jgi:hypothetical protein
MRNTYIPTDVFENLTLGLAKRLNDGLTQCMVSGKFEPHQIAEALADCAIMPVDMVQQIIIDQNSDAARQAERMVPVFAVA